MARLSANSEEFGPSLEPLVIGMSIDFGMTASGVAVDDGAVKPIRRDAASDSADGKIPTTISYHNDGRIAAWGFEHGQEKPRAKYLFKSLLDPESWNSTQQRRDADQSGFESRDMVRDCVRDYLACLLENSLRMVSKQTEKLHVVVNLTLTRPTTWTAAVVEDYRSIARKAFEKVTKECGPTLFLMLNSLRDETESHAAGTFVLKTSKTPMDQGGSIFLVVDVGGATTDPAFLQADRDRSGRLQLKSLMNPQLLGISVGCTDLDNCFSDHILQILRSKWEQENIGSLVDESSSALSVMRSVAEAFRFDAQWAAIRDNYSEASRVFPQLKISTMPSNGQNGVPDLQMTEITITRDEIKAIFDSALITPIRELIKGIVQILSSLNFSQERPFEIAHFILCGGGGLIPLVHDCVVDQMGVAITRANTLMAPALGALYISRDHVHRMHATVKVGTEKLGGDPKDVVWLTADARGEASSAASPTYSHQWKHHVSREVSALRQRFVLEFMNKHKLGKRRENWDVHLQIENITPRLRLGIFRSVKYRICLTLPTTTDVVTSMDFSAFEIGKDGRESRIECTATKTT